MVVFTPEERKNAYTLTVTKGENGTVVYPEHFFETYGTKKYKKNSIKTNIEKTISRYADSGMVYICEYEYIKIGVVCDKNDMPKYVVCRDSHFNFDKRRDNVDTDNEEIIKLLDTFDTLYNSYDWKVYDNRDKYQYVFDFDFFVDVDKAVHGALPDDYVFEPHGLETMAKNTIKTIDGRAYRFSKYGVCTGLYTGWSNTKSGRRFFRRGELVTGKTTINGKEYEFDKNGYLK
ncbi:MAG: hypothetical protein ILP19_03690 [Oscillospiraceae bacterium]|nr:hypothetical protein [Oscillospiraceae bacterium]